jgi:hypothetical protein
VSYCHARMPIRLTVVQKTINAVDSSEGFVNSHRRRNWGAVLFQ